jgi:cation:H+ antiporter
VLFGAMALLVWTAEVFTRAAERIGVYLGVPSFIIGVTIVAVGTSLPELVSSIVAVYAGAPEIVVANVVGSNITNIFLVLGVAAIIGVYLRVGYEIIHVDLPFLVGSAFLLALIIWDGDVTRVEAVALIAAAAIFVVYTVAETQRMHRDGETERVTAPRSEVARTWLLLLFGAAGIYVGARYTVESVVQISRILQVGTDIIALSAVALGTSLPELAVSVVASARGRLETAMGNVLGSSIFNATAVVGVTGLTGALVIPESVLSFGLPVMVLATLLFFFMAQDKEVSRWEGWLLVVFYALYIAKLFELI